MFVCLINTCVTFQQFLCSWANILEALGTLSTAVIALFALCYTKREYHKQKERTKISVLGKLNERYCNSAPIQRTIRFLMSREQYSDKPLESNKKEYNRWKELCSARDRELFMRFFAELQLSINAELIDKEYAKVMFGYYAVAASNMGKEFVDDYDEIYWSLFRTFAESMRQLDYSKCLEKMRNIH